MQVLENLKWRDSTRQEVLSMLEANGHVTFRHNGHECTLPYVGVATEEVSGLDDKDLKGKG